MKRIVTGLLFAALALGCSKEKDEGTVPPAPPTQAVEPAAPTTPTPADPTAPAEPEQPSTEPKDETNAPTKDSATVGSVAPDFTLPTIDGKEVKLADYKGKIVVLEWFNPDCPFVKAAYDQGPLPEMADKKGSPVVWLTVNSNAPGKQGSGVERNVQAKTAWKIQHPVLIDESGVVGLTYGALSTPHMFVIDKTGTVAYRGALDNAPLGKADGKPVNYVEAAVADLQAGRPVATPETRSYGCSVKYDN